jgi:hypothetical protein
MKATLTKLVLGSLVASLATSIHSGSIAAQSIENQCRLSVRAELMGPNCRTVNPTSSNDPCYIRNTNLSANYDNKVVACVAQGGPDAKHHFPGQNARVVFAERGFALLTIDPVHRLGQASNTVR